MPALGEYSNVYGTALLILQQKGFRLWYDESNALYCCEREGWDFQSDSPCGLLGLVTIFEHKQPTEFREYWWREQGTPDHRTLPCTPPDYVPVWRQR